MRVSDISFEWLEITNFVRRPHTNVRAKMRDIYIYIYMISGIGMMMCVKHGRVCVRRGVGEGFNVFRSGD